MSHMTIEQVCDRLYEYASSTELCLVESEEMADAIQRYIDAKKGDAVVWVDPDDVTEKRKAVMGTADKYGHEGTRYKLPLYTHSMPLEAVAGKGVVTDSVAMRALDAFYGEENWRKDFGYNVEQIVSEMKAALTSVAPMLAGSAENGEVFIVQDETGQPIYCASYPQACHDHINDAINEHGIEEAKRWKVICYSNYVLVPCHKCNSMRIASAVPNDK